MRWMASVSLTALLLASSALAVLPPRDEVEPSRVQEIFAANPESPQCPESCG